jgi:hypothetical protein
MSVDELLKEFSATLESTFNLDPWFWRRRRMSRCSELYYKRINIILLLLLLFFKIRADAPTNELSPGVLAHRRIRDRKKID